MRKRGGEGKKWCMRRRSREEEEWSHMMCVEEKKGKGKMAICGVCGPLFPNFLASEILHYFVHSGGWEKDEKAGA